MSARLEILPVDPYDAAAVDALHAAYLAAAAPMGPLASPWQLEEMRAALQDDGKRASVRAWAGVCDGRVVSAGMLRLSLLDNLDRAEVDVHTVPDARRRGHASSMLRHLEAEAVAADRGVLAAETVWRHAAGPAGDGEPGAEFARAAGFALALGDVKRELRLPVDEQVLDALAAEAAPHHASYTLRSWAGPVPEDLLEGWAALTAALMTEAPVGDLAVEEVPADPAVVREEEALIERQGRRKYNTVALDAAGAVVAYTDIATTIHEPDHAYQWGTLVRRADRGHRLGLATKVANLRLLQRECPQVRVLTSYNAEVNAPMVAVNDRLGFVPVARLGEFQKRLG